MKASPLISYSIKKYFINYTQKELGNAPLSTMLTASFTFHEDYFVFFLIESVSYIKHIIPLVFEACKTSKTIYFHMSRIRAIYVQRILRYLILNSAEQ